MIINHVVVKSDKHPTEGKIHRKHLRVFNSFAFVFLFELSRVSESLFIAAPYKGVATATLVKLKYRHGDTQSGKNDLSNCIAKP